MVTLLVTKPGVLTQLDKEKLREDEIVVVESHEPDSVRWLKPSEVFGSAELVSTAKKLLANSELFESPDGLARSAELAYWDELEAALGA